MSKSFALGLVGGTIMMLMGPRPIFVQTAYAQAEPVIEQVAMDVVEAEALEPVLVETTD